MNPLTTSAFDLPDHLAAKADPALIAGDEQHFAAIAESLEQSIADLSDRLDAERKAPGGNGQAGAGPGPGDPPADRPPAHAAPLRPGPVPRAHRRRRRPRARVHRTARPHRQRGSPAAARLALPRRRAVLRRDPRQPDGAGQPPPVPLDPRPDQRLLGRGVHPGRVRGARRRARRPVRLHRQPGQQPVGPDARRARHHPGRPGRHHPRGIRAARSSSTAVRAPGRPSSPCTAPPTCSTPTRASVTAGAACCSSARTSPTWPTSPTSCPASARRACRPAPCGTSSPRAPRRRRDRPGRGPAEVVRGPGEGDRARPSGSTRSRRPSGDDGRDRLGRHLAERRRLGRGVRGAEPGHPAQRGARPDLGGAAHDPGRQARRRRAGRRCSAGRCCANRELRATFNRAWPLLEAADLVGDLWSVPAYLRRCAPWLSPDDVRKLQRDDAQAWTVSDLPLLDAARQRLGDPERRGAGAGTRPRSPPNASSMARVVDDLIAADDYETAGPVTMLRQRGPAGRPGRRGRAARPPTRTCSPARSRTSSWTRPRS